MKRAALYVRVSTDEQKKHGLSVDNQIQALTDYCNANGYIISGIYNDAGHTAAKSYNKRPALLNLIADVQAGKIDIILCTRLDRWFRNVKEYHKVQEYLDASKVPWKTIWEDYETESANGRFKVNIMLSIAEAEAARTSEKIKSVMEYKKDRGDYVGMAPYGYIKHNSQLYKDEEKAEGIAVFFREYMTTYSVHKACAIAVNYGFTYPVEIAYRMLKNPIYAGTAKNGYKVEPYITQEEFELINDIVKRNTRTVKNPKVHNEYIFSGLVYCTKCNKRMPASSDREWRVKTQTYWVNLKYKCKKYGVGHAESNNVREKDIEDYLLARIDDLIEERIKSADVAYKPAVNNNAKRAKLESKLKRLTNLYAEGDLSLEEYRTKRNATKAELDAIIDEPTGVPERLPDNWKEIYKQLDVEHKRAFWLKIIDKIYVYRWEYKIIFR